MSGLLFVCARNRAERIGVFPCFWHFLKIIFGT